MVTYHRPSTLDEALAIRAAGPVTVLAGGTDVYPAKAARAGWGDMRQADILDISALDALRGIAEEAQGWRIGALATWTQLMEARLPPLFDGLKLAAREVGGVQIQNRGTLAGNICTASPAGDGAPNLLALEAHIELASQAGRRVVPMAEFIDGYRRTQCRADEIVTGILVPKPRNAARSHFVKLGARKYLVISIVMVAGVVETDAAGCITSASAFCCALSSTVTFMPLSRRTLMSSAGMSSLAGSERCSAFFAAAATALRRSAGSPFHQVGLTMRLS